MAKKKLLGDDIDEMLPAGSFTNEETGEQSLSGEAEADFKARTEKNGPEPKLRKGEEPPAAE